MWAVDVPSSLGTIPTLFASVLLSSSFSITTLPGQYYYYPPSSLNSSSEGGIGHALVFEHSFAEPSLSYVLLGSRPDGAVTSSRCYPPRFRDFLEELVVGDGVKTLGLHLRAACRGVVLLIFGSIYFRSRIIVYTDSLILSI